jgi:hypothetical protein
MQVARSDTFARQVLIVGVTVAKEAICGGGRYYCDVGAGMDLIHETNAAPGGFIVLDDAQAVDPEIPKPRNLYKLYSISNDLRHPLQDAAAQEALTAKVGEIILP